MRVDGGAQPSQTTASQGPDQAQQTSSATPAGADATSATSTPSASSAAQSAPTEQSARTAWAEHASDAAGARAAAQVQPQPEPSMLDRAGSWMHRQSDRARAGVRRFEQGAAAVADHVSDRVNAAAYQVSETAHRAADEVSDGAAHLAQGASEAIDEVRRGGEGLARSAEQGLEVAGQAAREVGENAAESVHQGVEQMRSGAAALAQTGREVMDSVREYGDIDGQVRELNEPGDSLRYEVGGGVEVEARGEVSGSVEVRQVGTESAPDYQVTVSGSAAVGVQPALGLNAGGQLQAEGRAMGGAGASVELHFDNPEDAARAVRISRNTAAVGAATVAGSGLGPSGMAAAGALAEAAIGPSADDLSFMAEHTRAVEFRLQGDARLSATAGIGLDDNQLRLAGGETSFGENAAVGVRVTMPHDGNPAQVTVFAEAGVSAGGSGSLGLRALEGEGTQRVDGSGAGLGIGAGVEGSLRGRIEYTMDLPENVDTAAFLRNPQGEASRYARDAVANGEARLTLTAEGSAHASGVVGGSEQAQTEISVRGRPEDVQRAWRETQQNGAQAGLRSLGDGTEVEVRTETTRTRGYSVSPVLSAFGVGADVHVAAERAERTESPPWSGTGTEAADRLAGRARPRGMGHGPVAD